jgi:hypothetical protein
MTSNNYIYFFDEKFDSVFDLPSDFRWHKIMCVNDVGLLPIGGIKYTGSKKLNIKVLNEIFDKIEDCLKNPTQCIRSCLFTLINIDYPYHDLRTYCLVRTGKARGSKVELLDRIHSCLFQNIPNAKIPPVLTIINYRNEKEKWIQ